jgi:hypothetical protein
VSVAEEATSGSAISAPKAMIFGSREPLTVFAKERFLMLETAGISVMIFIFFWGS